jgi:hypothetical protein
LSPNPEAGEWLRLSLGKMLLSRHAGALMPCLRRGPFGNVVRGHLWMPGAQREYKSQNDRNYPGRGDPARHLIEQETAATKP